MERSYNNVQQVQQEVPVSLEIPPVLYIAIVRETSRDGTVKHRRVLMEKPGYLDPHDLESRAVEEVFEYKLQAEPDPNVVDTLTDYNCPRALSIIL